MLFSSYSNCNNHNAKSTSVCLDPNCKLRLACNTCVMTEHKGHVDQYVVPIHKFLGNIQKEFQRPEMDRLQRIHHKIDLLIHIEKEFRYLRDKLDSILKDKEQKLAQYVQSQYIHSTSFQNVIDQLNFMKDGKVYEEGLQVVLPLLLKEGVQENLVRYEREKINIQLKVKEQINQVKTVLDGLFYIGNQYQQDQQKLTKSDSTPYFLSNSKSPLAQQEDQLFRSAVYPSQRINKSAFSHYNEFVDALYPSDPIDIYQPQLNQVNERYAPAFPNQEFEVNQQQVDKVMRLKLLGVLEHESYIHSSVHLRTGEVISCSNMLTVWKPPELKPIQQTAYNFGIKYIVELMPQFIVASSKQSINSYERKEGKWIPKGEFITPGVGQFYKLALSDSHCAQKLLCILVSTQMLTYRIMDEKQDLSGRIALENLIANTNPTAYQHKWECTAVAFELDGGRMITGDSGGRLYRWKIGNAFNVEQIVQANNSEIVGIVCLHDGRVVSVGMDGLIKMWERSLTQNQPISIVKHRSQISSCATIWKEIDTFMTGDVKGRIQLWKVSVVVNALIEIDAHSDSVTHIFYSQFYKSQVVTSSADKKVKIWNLII